MSAILKLLFIDLAQYEQITTMISLMLAKVIMTIMMMVMHISKKANLLDWGCLCRNGVLCPSADISYGQNKTTIQRDTHANYYYYDKKNSDYDCDDEVHQHAGQPTGQGMPVIDWCCLSSGGYC